MSVIDVNIVLDRLDKTSDPDGEIQDMLNAAEAAYERLIGPLPGTVTEVFDGGSSVLVLRDSNASAITGASYDSGAALTYTDLTVSNGIVRWGYGTSGRFLAGTRVTVEYTVGDIPDDHRETIIADVAGYFATTQRGPLGLLQEGEGYEQAAAITPLTLFPRIQELAKSYPVVA